MGHTSHRNIPFVILAMTLTLLLSTNICTISSPDYIHQAFIGGNKCLEHWTLSKQKHFAFKDVQTYNNKKASYFNKSSSQLGEAIRKKNLNRTIVALDRLGAEHSSESLAAIAQAFDCGTKEFLSQYQKIVSPMSSDAYRRNFTKSYIVWKSVIIFSFEIHLRSLIGDPRDFLPVYSISTKATNIQSSSESNVKDSNSNIDPYTKIFVSDVNLGQQTFTASVDPIDQIIHYSTGDSVPLPGTEENSQLMVDIAAVMA